MSKSIRVLHLSGSHNVWGGNETQLKTLIECSESLPISHHIFCFEESPMHLFCREKGIEYTATPRYKDYSPKLLKLLRDCVTKYQIDVIHIHTSNSVLTYMLSSIFYNLNVACVFSKKGISDKSTFFSRLKYNYPKIDKIICVAPVVKEAFKKVIRPKNHHKLEVIYDGILIDDRLSKSDINLREKFGISSTYLIGNIANHSEAKDLPTLIRAIHHLVYVKQFTDLHLIQIGRELHTTPEIKSLVQSLHLNDYITFVGEVENAKSFLPQFDAYVMSSKTEGLPITIYEAFMYKIPVISTRAGGIPNAITDGFNGLLAPIGNYKMLAEKIQQLLTSHELRGVIVENAYTQLLKEFDAKINAQKTFEIYKTII